MIKAGTTYKITATANRKRLTVTYPAIDNLDDVHWIYDVLKQLVVIGENFDPNKTGIQWKNRVLLAVVVTINDHADASPSAKQLFEIMSKIKGNGIVIDNDEATADKYIKAISAAIGWPILIDQQLVFVETLTILSTTGQVERDVTEIFNL